VLSAIAVRPSYEHTPGVPASRRGEHSTVAVALRQELVDNIVEGLQIPSGNAWVDYWNTANRLDDFTHLLHVLTAATKAAGIALDVETHQQAKAQRKLDEYLGEAAQQLDFADATMERAVRIADRITKITVPLQLQKDDAACAQRFNLSAKWYSLARATLQVVADEEEPAPRPLEPADGVIESILVFIRLATLEAHHAVMEGARLRAPEASSPDVHASALEDLPDDVEEVERQIQRVEIH
jgi:hypothetical protein